MSDQENNARSTLQKFKNTLQKPYMAVSVPHRCVVVKLHHLLSQQGKEARRSHFRDGVNRKGRASRRGGDGPAESRACGQSRRPPARQGPPPELEGTLECPAWRYRARPAPPPPGRPTITLRYVAVHRIHNVRYGREGGRAAGPDERSLA